VLPTAELAARGSLGVLQQRDGLGKRARSRGDKETFKACIPDVSEGRCKVFRADVSKVDLDVSMLRMLILPPQRSILDVANVDFECCGILSSCCTQHDLMLR
jgi:hypothetical protein